MLSRQERENTERVRRLLEPYRYHDTLPRAFRIALADVFKRLTAEDKFIMSLFCLKVLNVGLYEFVSHAQRLEYNFLSPIRINYSSICMATGGNLYPSILTEGAVQDAPGKNGPDR